ncbi:MAG: hypothetical protein JNL70_25590 [Saprospiraceae bacterium]|nr:hypothetical protein [Saprospiraceae bacterium]
MMRLSFVFTLILLSKINLNAQTPDSLPHWETYKENVFNIRYPATDWVKTDELNARFCIATKATVQKPYDRDLIKIEVMDNEDGLHGTMDEFTKKYTDELRMDKQTQLVASERLKKGTLEYHEIIAKSLAGKLKRQWKERYYFVNGKIIRSVFDAQQKVYDLMLPQADSILQTLTSVDFEATTVSQWRVFEHPQLTFTYPSQWTLSEMPPQHTIFQLFKPKKSDDRGFRDNLYLAENTFKESIPELGSYAQRATEQLKATLKNAQILQSTRKKQGSLAYQEVVSTGTLGTHEVKMQQWHFVKGKKAYTLVFVARADKFDESKDVVGELFKSFKLK